MSEGGEKEGWEGIGGVCGVEREGGGAGEFAGKEIWFG